MQHTPHSVTFSFLLSLFRSENRTYPSLSDRGEDGPADHAGVGVEFYVIQQQAGGQQHGRGVCCVVVSDALTGVPGALHIEEHVDFVNRGTCHSFYIWS